MYREYSSTSTSTTLATSLGGLITDTTMTVASGTATALLGGVSLAAGNADQFTVALDPDTSSEEIVFITAVSGDNFTIVRGQAGTSITTHGAGAVVQHVMSSDDLIYFNTGNPKTIVTAKGDLVVGTSSGNVSRLGVGTNNYILTADSAQTTGIKWAAAPTELPSQTGNSGKYLTTDGTNPSWAAVSYPDISFNSQTGTTYTLVAGDLNKLVTLDNSSAVTVTIPSATFTSGQQVNLQQIGAGQVTIQGNGTSTFTGTGTKLRAQYSAATLICTGSNTFTLIGDIA